MRLSALLALLLTSVAGLAAAEHWYVATDGSDSSADPHDPATPLRTIQAAADQAAAGDTVFIAGGVYRETVRPAASGTGADQQITFRSSPGERAVISGADPVGAIAADGATWQQEGGSAIWSIALDGVYDSPLGYDDQLFVDGRMWELARHPTLTSGDRLQPGPGGWFYFDSHVDKVNADEYDGWPSGRGSEISITSSQLTEADGYWDDATIWIAPSENQSWQFGFVGPVLDYRHGAAGGTIRATIYTETQSFFHLHDRSTRFYLFNCSAALDAPGEWYRDPVTNRLYVHLQDGQTPDELSVEMRRRDLAFDLDRRNWITIADLDIVAATISTDADLGDGDVYGHAANNGGRATGSIASAEHITIDGIDARYVSHFTGTTGWYQSQWYDISGILLSGSDHTITDSVVMHSAGNGVMLWGRGHRVLNNFISDTQYVLARGGGVCMPTRSAWDMEVGYNTIVRSGWTAVDSDECQVDFHHNLVDGYSLLGHDSGGTHFVGSGWDDNDVTIRYNVFRNGLGFDVQGIYFDFCDGYLVHHNLIYEAVNAININGSFGGKVYNNSFVTFDGGIGGRWNSGGGMRYTEIVNNLGNKNIDDRHRDGEPGFVYRDNLRKIDPEAYFVDWQRGDFRLRDSATAAIDQGSTLSGITGGSVGAPDIGAVERGAAGERWWTDIGCPASVIPVATPTDLQLHLRPDVGVLTWTDQADNEQGYVIERSWHVQATGDKQIKGRDFEVIGQVGPDVTSFADTAMPVHEENVVHYRVRAVNGSAYSNNAQRPAGRMGGRLAGFEAGEGYQTGLLAGQSSWRGHYPNYASPFEPLVADNLHVVDDGAGGHRVLATQGNGEVVNYYGDLAAVDPAFDPNTSTVRIAFRVGLLQERGDSGNALLIGLGGPSYPSHWAGPQNRMIDFRLRRDGWLYLGGTGLARLSDLGDPADGALVELILDWSTARMRALVDGVERANGIAFDRDRDLSKVLVMLRGTPYNDAHAAWFDDLAISADDNDTPRIFCTSDDPDTREGSLDPADLVVGRDWSDGSDVTVTISVAGSATTEDYRLRDAAGDLVTVSGGQFDCRLAGHQRQARYTVEAVADGLSEGDETVSLSIVDGAGYAPDTAIAATTLLIRDGADGTPSGEAPRIDAGPTADDDPVTGTSTRLRVVASDPDGDDAALHYRWTVLAEPDGATPAISPNDATGANEVQVAFDHAGSYRFRVTVSDADGLRVSGTVELVVEQVANDVLVSP